MPKDDDHTVRGGKSPQSGRGRPHEGNRHEPHQGFNPGPGLGHPINKPPMKGKQFKVGGKQVPQKKGHVIKGVADQQMDEAMGRAKRGERPSGGGGGRPPQPKKNDGCVVLVLAFLGGVAGIITVVTHLPL